MKIDRVSHNFGRTFPMPNYASARIDIGYEATLDPGETPDEATLRLHALAMAEVRRIAVERGYIAAP